MAWNGSGGRVRPSASPGAKPRPSPVRGAVAGLVVVSVAAAVVWFVFRGNVRDSGDETSARNRGGDAVRRLPAKIGAKVSAAPRRAEKAANAPVAVSPAQAESPESEQARQGGVTNSAKIAEDTRTFRNPMDQLLAMVAPRNAGDAVPPVPITDDMEFTEAEERKILERLTADDRDSDAIVERKEFVQALRDEYFELKKRGWTFVEYVKALEAKANMDNELLEESQRIHETIFNDRNISDEVYEKSLAAINDMLAKRGIKPIHPPQEEPDADDSEEEKR